MKKIFTLFAALAMVMSMSAATKTIYCKMAQSWWKADGAAVGAYYWGTGSGPAWPGTRMTKVAGETDLWSIDIDTSKFNKIIFTRVNGSGTVSNWGAKTADQNIPTDDKNLFTITSSSPVWGDPGCTGTWSTYAPDAPKTYKDITITVTANAAASIKWSDAGDKLANATAYVAMTAGENNTYSYTLKQVDEASGVNFTIKVGDIESASKNTNTNFTADFKELMKKVVVKGVTSWDDKDIMTVSDDYLTASITLPLVVKKYDLKLTVDGAWKGHKNENNITRAKNSSVFKNDDGNGSITADIAGDYVFTYTYANQTLTVTYPALPVKYNVTVTAENGTVTGAGEYEEGKEATLTATPAEGYEFVNWTKGEEVVSTENPYKFTVTADVALVANFIKKTISYEMNGGAFPEVKVPTNEELALVFKQEYAEYFAIEGLTDTDMKREVGNFIYVTNSKGGDAIKFITENANWKWLHDYILTVAGNIPEGTNVGYYWRANLDGFFHCKNAVAVGGVASADYTEAGKPENWGPAYQAAHAVVLPTEPVDAPYTLPTPVKEGYKFVGWYDNAEGTGEPMTVIPAGWDGTLYAIWVEIYTITVEAENGTVEGAGNYEHGAEATLTATAAEGYEFTCWTSGEDTVSTANPYKFTVTADVALVANFKEAEPEYDVMDITMTNLVVQEMEDFVVLTASDDSNTGLNVMLAVNEDGSLAADSYMAMVQGWNEVELPIVEGTITKTYSEELATDVYSGLVVVEYNEGYLGLDLTMYYVAPEYTDIVITNATVTEDIRDLGWGDETYTVLLLESTWSDGVETYPVLVEVNDYDLSVVEGTAVVSVTIGGQGDEDPWLGNVPDGEMKYTIADGVITLQGKLENASAWPAPVYWNLTISGKLPQGPTTALDNIAIEAKAIKMIKNGQLIIIKNGVQYNVQGQVIK